MMIPERAEMFNEALKAAKTSGRMKHITCAKCGVDVVVPARATNAKYCPTCSKNLLKAKQKEYRENLRRKVTGICTRCGVEFEYVYKGTERALCDDCKSAYNGRPTKKKEKKETRVSLIEAINSAARKAGMSYGQYQALRAMGRV